ncbi:hypothetical protein VP01_1396g6 [Puccinia sorghi]|uniref:Uncharacterized protein n=1 Tax=Puccinia sorghi TaxID=27349 RepID=A0A0L6VL87_9BASI|nr:hypothetical protein VP01_1396g6 [Puccinia sorghi]
MLPKSLETQKKLKKSCIIRLSLSEFQLLAIFIFTSNNSLLSKKEISSSTWKNSGFPLLLAGFHKAVKLITLALKEKHHKIKSFFHQKKVTSLQNINSIFAISQKLKTVILCRHKIAQFLASGQQVEPSDFNMQWHLKVSFFYFSNKASIRMLQYHIPPCDSTLGRKTHSETLQGATKVESTPQRCYSFNIASRRYLKDATLPI